MAAYKEIFAELFLKVDTTPIGKAEKAFDNFNKKMLKFGAGLAGVWTAAATGAFTLIQKGSAATETVNAINTTFEEGGKSALAWADHAAKAMGRSKYEMRATINDFGKLLEPTFQGSNEQLVEMSTALAGLTTDLASFHDINDQEAALKLRSGLMGETEAVRSLGIDLSDESLDAFSAQHGGKRVRDMAMNEKMQLRFAKILQDTRKAQGDAQRTGGGWSNQLKRAMGSIEDTLTDLGLRLMETFTPWLRFINDSILPAFYKLVNGTTALDSAFLALKIVTLVFAAALTAANAPLVLLAGAISLVYLAFDDVYALFTGNNSVIGEFFEELWGIKDIGQVFSDVWSDVIRSFVTLPAQFEDLFNHIKFRLSAGQAGYEDNRATGAANVAFEKERAAELETKRMYLAATGQNQAFQESFTQTERADNFAGIEDMWFKLREAAARAQAKGLPSSFQKHAESDEFLLAQMGIEDFSSLRPGGGSPLGAASGGASGGGAGGGVNVVVNVDKMQDGVSLDELALKIEQGVTNGLKLSFDQSMSMVSEGAR